MALPVICVTLRGEPLLQGTSSSGAGQMQPQFRIVPSRSVSAFLKVYGGNLGADGKWGSTADGVACASMEVAEGVDARSAADDASKEIEFELSGTYDRDVMLTLIDVKQGHRDVMLGECFIPLATLMPGLLSRGHYHFCIPTTTEVRHAPTVEWRANCLVSRSMLRSM